MAHYDVGVDLVEVRKVRQIFEGRQSLQEAVFTGAELRRALKRRDGYACLAAYFAAKEAIFKALGTGLSGDMDWREVEIDEEVPGRPVIRLQGGTAQDARAKGVVGGTISLSSTKDYAAALVVLGASTAGLDPHPNPLPGREMEGRG